MGAHVFLVGEANFEVCIRRGLYGCVMPTTEWNKAEVVAGIFSVQPNDLVFFYVKNRGIYGLWKVVGETFFDEARIWDHVDQSFPFRFTFAPVVGQFATPVSLSDVLDLRDKGRVWTFDLNHRSVCTGDSPSYRNRFDSRQRRARSLRRLAERVVYENACERRIEGHAGRLPRVLKPCTDELQQGYGRVSDTRHISRWHRNTSQVHMPGTQGRPRDSR